MARPLKEGLDYFPHDVDLSNDDKIEMLESKYGLAGYAIYLKLLEKVYKNGGKLSLKEPGMMERLARKWAVDNPVHNPVDKVVDNLVWLENVIDWMVLAKLWQKRDWERGKLLISEGVTKRMEVVKNKRDKERNRHGQKELLEISAEFLPQKPYKVKESKVNSYVPPNEINKLLEEKLGKHAPIKDIKNVLEILPENIWWTIDKFLKKRYPGGGNGFEIATQEIYALRTQENINI